MKIGEKEKDFLLKASKSNGPIFKNTTLNPQFVFSIDKFQFGNPKDQKMKLIG